MHDGSVYPDSFIGAYCYLSGDLVQGNCFEGLIVVIVDGLEEGVVVGEDGDRIAAYVRLQRLLVVS